MYYPSCCYVYTNYDRCRSRSDDPCLKSCHSLCRPCLPCSSLSASSPCTPCTPRTPCTPCTPCTPSSTKRTEKFSDFAGGSCAPDADDGRRDKFKTQKDKGKSKKKKKFRGKDVSHGSGDGKKRKKRRSKGEGGENEDEPDDKQEKETQIGPKKKGTKGTQKKDDDKKNVASKESKGTMLDIDKKDEEIQNKGPTDHDSKKPSIDSGNGPSLPGSRGGTTSQNIPPGGMTSQNIPPGGINSGVYTPRTNICPNPMCPSNLRRQQNYMSYVTPPPVKKSKCYCDEADKVVPKIVQRCCKCGKKKKPKIISENRKCLCCDKSHEVKANTYLQEKPNDIRNNNFTSVSFPVIDLQPCPQMNNNFPSHNCTSKCSHLITLITKNNQMLHYHMSEVDM